MAKTEKGHGNAVLDEDLKKFFIPHKKLNQGHQMKRPSQYIPYLGTSRR